LASLRKIRARYLIIPAALACGAALLFLVAFAGGSDDPQGMAEARAELPPDPWAANPGGRAPDASEIKRQAILDRRAAKAAADIDPATGMPPASAGSNGSYEPPPPEERKRISAATHPEGAVDSAHTATLLNGTALAPAGAPDPIQGAISAANLLVGQPYRLGGGHGSWRSRGYDCSGAVSYALAGGGMVRAPLTSGQFMSWGAPGPGEWLTIYANPGHVYAVIGGLRWDTVGDARGSGPRWHPFDAYPQGFAVRHFPGL
jgi:cell wall-associated NlpC family hydrolase